MMSAALYGQDTHPNYTPTQIDSAIKGLKSIDIPSHFNSNGDLQTLDIRVKDLSDGIISVIPAVKGRNGLRNAGLDSVHLGGVIIEKTIVYDPAQKGVYYSKNNNPDMNNIYENNATWYLSNSTTDYWDGSYTGAYTVGAKNGNDGDGGVQMNLFTNFMLLRAESGGSLTDFRFSDQGLEIRPNFSNSSGLTLTGFNNSSPTQNVNYLGFNNNGLVVPVPKPAFTGSYLKFNLQFPIIGTGVPNGSLFFGTDGALYYKGGSGTVTFIAPN